MPGSNNTEAEEEDDKTNPYAGSAEDIAEYIEKNNIPGPVWMEEIADADDLAAVQAALDNLASDPAMPLPEQQGPPLPPDYTPPGVGAAPPLNNPYTTPPVTSPVPPETTQPIDIDPGVIPGSGSIYTGGVGAGAGTFVPISAIQGQLDDLRQDDLDAYNAIMGNVTPTGTVEINEDTLAAIEALQAQADAPGQTIAEKPDEVAATPDSELTTPIDAEEEVAVPVTTPEVDPIELDIKLILDALESGDEAAAAQAIANAQNAAATQKAVADASTTTQEAVTGAAGETQDVVTTSAGETQDVVTTTAGETQDAIATLQEAVDAGALTFEDLVNSGFLDVTETFADTYEDLATQIETGQTDLATAIDNGLASVNTDIADQFGDVTTGLEGVAESVTDTQQAVEDTASETQTAVGEAASETQDVVTTTAGDTQETVTTTAGETQDVVTTSAGETQDVVTTAAGETQEAIQKAAKNTDQAISTLAEAMGVTQDEIKEAVNNGNTQVIEGLAEIETLLAQSDEAIEAVAEQVGLTGEELTKVIQDGDNKVVEVIKGLADRVDDLPGPIADALAPYFELVESGVSALTDGQEKSFTKVLEAIASQTSGLTQTFAETGLLTVTALSELKDTITGIATSTYNKFFAPDEPGEAMTGEEYAADLANAASIDRTGGGFGSGGSEVIGGTGGGFGAGSRDPVNITDYISVDNDTQTGSGGGNIVTDPTSGTGTQGNAFTRPVPIANQELYGGYMGQAQRLSGTLDTYPQLQRQASEQYGAQVAAQFPALSQDQQSMFSDYVTSKVQAKAGIGQDPGFLPYDIYNIVAPRLSEVLGDIGYYQYSSGRRIPGFMNYMPDYQDSMFNRQDIGTDPLPGGPPPTQPGFV